MSKIPADELLDDVNRVADELGHPPAAAEYEEHGNYGHSTLRRRFGSWSAAKEESDVDARHSHQTPEADLLEDLQRVANEIGRSPTSAEYQKHGSYSESVFRNQFDSWNAAKEEAALETYEKGQKQVSNKKLLDDLREVSNKLGHSPTAAEYEEHGVYSRMTFDNHFDSWNAAKDEVGLKIARRGSEIFDDELLIEDLQRVAAKLGKSPQVNEYNTHGKWTERAIYKRFDSWNEALDDAGLPLRNSRGIKDEDFLRHLRKRWKESQATTETDFIQNSTKFSNRSCTRRFGNVWKALVRAGIDPPVSPLSESDYDQYIQTAINIENPHLSLIGLLRAFTGIPLPTLTYFELSWLSRLNDDYQPPLLTVPSKYIVADENWVMILPTNYTVAGEEKPTNLGGILSWMKGTFEVTESKRKQIDEIINKAGLDVGPASLRASVGAHLVRRGISREKIEMQIGADKLDWWRSVEDFYLYIYHFEGYCHPDYEPSGTYLDPVSGKATKIESKGE